jgi:phage shock protein C
MKRLYRSRKNKVIAGVCGGIGEYYDIDPVIIRLVWVLFSLLSFGMGVLGYLIAWMIIPKSPKK